MWRDSLCTERNWRDAIFCGRQQNPSYQETKLHFLGLSGTHSLLFLRPLSSYIRHKILSTVLLALLSKYWGLHANFLPTFSFHRLISSHCSFRIILCTFITSLQSFLTLSFFQLVPPHIFHFNLVSLFSFSCRESIIPVNGLSVACVDNQPCWVGHGKLIITTIQVTIHCWKGMHVFETSGESGMKRTRVKGENEIII